MTLNDDPVIIDIRHRIQKDIDHYTEVVAGGGTSGYDDYKRLVGIIKGLKLALNKIEDSIKLYLNDEDT